MDWKQELKSNVTDVKGLQSSFDLQLSTEEAEKFNEIIDLYPMSIPKYYLSLIEPDNEHDPIRRMCIPSYKETDLTGNLDTSGEADNTVVTGLQHKYKQTALILSTNQCAMYCRHCFRKRLVGLNSREIIKHFDEMIDYINEHNEIHNVLISGGDAFLNSNEMIKTYLDELARIKHLDYIRFGTRTPVVLPSRIYGDDELLSILKKYSELKKIYVVTHFNHPNELTNEAKKAIDSLLNAGIIIKNQTVLLKGVNDSSEVLVELIKKLTQFGIVPYYIFQCRPVTGVKSQFQVPILKGYSIIRETKAKLSGQGKCFHYVLSNKRGKIEVLGTLFEKTMIFKYHEAKYEIDQERIFTLDLAEEQCWI
ncbi:MAG: KamA family radical protein [Anaerocolumna sp.]|jgi:KamA family protein|nr:KamA family radical protein [Anaerocolumna sp.]